MTRSRFSVAGMLTRHVRAGGATSATLSLLVLITTAVLAALPGTMDAIGGAELHYQLDHLSPNLRFLTSRVLDRPLLGPPPPGTAASVPADTAQIWGALDVGLATIRAEAPELLRSRLGAARFTSYSEVLGLSQPPSGSSVGGEFRIVLAADPHLSDSARLIAGGWPTPVVQEFPLTSPVGIALSSATAARMGWTIGAVRIPDSDPRQRIRLQLTGIFQAKPDAGDYWTVNRSILQPNERLTPDTDIVTGTGFVHAAGWPTTAGFAGSGFMQLYYPFEGGGLRQDQIELLRTQLEKFTNRPRTIDGDQGTDPLVMSSVRLSSKVPETLGTVSDSVRSADAVLSVIAVGPAGAALATLLVGCRLLVARRRPAFALLSARGGSQGLLRAAFAVEGLLLSVPPASAATLLVLRWLPPDAPRSAVILPVLVVVAPALLLASSLSRRRPGRGDLSLRSRGRLRGVLEAALLGLAAASTVLLYRSGASVRSGLDPLVLAAPLLVCVAAGAALLRLYPVPLLAVHRWLRGRRGLVDFLGSGRTIRDGTAGIVPLLALVIGVAMTMLTAVLLSSLHSGLAAASRTQIGADLRVLKGDLSADEVTAVRTVPGVETVAQTQTLGVARISVSGLASTVQLYAVDATALATVQTDVPGAAPVRAGLATRTGKGIPVVTAPRFAGLELSAGGDRLTVVATSPSTAGLGRAADWVVVDKAFVRSFGTQSFQPDTLFVRLKPGADPADVQQRILFAVPDASVGTPGELAAVVAGSPVIGGVGSALLVAVAVMGLLCAGVVMMTTVAGGAARQKVLTVLRVLGLPAESIGRLIGWELAPAALAALIGGAVVGGGLSRIVFDVVDLRPFVGGATQPAVVVDPGLMALLLGGIVMLVLLSIVVSGRVARRTGLAAALRFGDG